MPAGQGGKRAAASDREQQARELDRRARALSGQLDRMFSGKGLDAFLAEGLPSTPAAGGGGGGDTSGTTVGSKTKSGRFDKAQRSFLEAAFNQEPNPSEEQRQAFAAQLNLTEKQVRNWFQNKRQRLKGRATQHHNSKLASANEDLAEEYAELKVRNTEAERENKVLRAQIKKLAAKLEDLQDSTSLLLIQYYKTRGQMEGQAPPLPAGLSKIGSALGGAPPPAAGAETQPRLTPLDPSRVTKATVAGPAEARSRH